MKQRAIALFFLFAAITLHAKAIQEEINLADENARISYAFGMTVGVDLKQAGLEFDYAAFTEGLKNAMEQEPALMDQDEALEIVQTAFEKAMAKQADELRAKEEKFLAENALNEGVISNPSGLQYMVLAEGKGPKPSTDDTVRVHYEGALVDGTVFDSSYHLERGEEIPLDMVIPGWAEGIQLMSVGSKYRIYIPSRLAYGERGAGQVIPPYSTLVFTIELLEILDAGGEDRNEN
ncbi:MAG: FKBP-type peptidyl-prolyl cis-trans isomerase [Treponema sp.]|jgi:FKBP-type peptidyl-prolyl cis-trans isomerase FkpA|nr:FKBP-type peptidyl-prolyl cis-trans isomerase [Treponema sp.]